MFPLISSPETYEFDAGKAWRVPIGAASPLWFMFAGAATAGMAYWWMTRLPTLAVNLEAVLEPGAPPQIALPTPEPAPEPPQTLAEAVAEVIPAATVIEEPPIVEEPAVLAEPTPVEAQAEPNPAKAAKTKAPPTDDHPLTH